MNWMMLLFFVIAFLLLAATLLFVLNVFVTAFITTVYEFHNRL